MPRHPLDDMAWSGSGVANRLNESQTCGELRTNAHDGQSRELESRRRYQNVGQVGTAC